ncbi:MAG: NAD-dependent epimerase/dehydratase family protein, partial [Oxalobacteraceae bacterium]
MLSSTVREGAGKRALITGLAGFTGRYMAQELTDAGYRVFGTAM